MLPSSLGRWWYTLRYHRPSQIAWRGLRRLRGAVRRLGVVKLAPRPPEGTLEVRPDGRFAELLRARVAARPGDPGQRARDLAEGRFVFLGREIRLHEPVDWRLGDTPDATPLWRFHLHYHEFLLDLAAQRLADGDPAWTNRAWRLVDDWIEGNPPGDPAATADAWHPFCISRRLPVWMVLLAAFHPPGDQRRRVLASIALQAEALRRNFEWDLGGNHLLENAKALVLAGAFWKGPAAERWLRRGRRVLHAQIAEQILPHGEHYERSPMYHALMLEALLDVRDAVAAEQPELARLCAATAEKMAAWLQSVLHPDGQIPLLGDSTLDETPLPAALLARAASSVAFRSAKVAGVERGVEKGDITDFHSTTQGPSPKISDDVPFSPSFSPYWTFRSGDDLLLFDAGPAALDHLPAHGHADLLGLEASIAGRRVLVDSGVFDYEAGEMRGYCRSSAAHNVLLVDDADQCDTWSRFRMGYRGWPTPLETGTAEGFRWARSTHNAYRRLGVPVVGRWVACRPEGPWFIVDWAEGRGRHRLASLLHFHPDVLVDPQGNGEVRLIVPGAVLRLSALGPGVVRQWRGWYCPRFGTRQSASVLRLELEAPFERSSFRSGSLPPILGWCLRREECVGEAHLDASSFPDLRLYWTAGGQESTLRPLATLSRSRC